MPLRPFSFGGTPLSPGAAVFVSSNNLSNGSVIANFSPMESNEANFCKGYNYDNGRFIFNFRGAVSKISDYVFSDGHKGIIAKLSELALKSDLSWKTLGTVSNAEILDITNIAKTANEICIAVFFPIDKGERDYFSIIPIDGLGDTTSVITIGGYYAAAGDYGVVQVNASTSGIGLATVYHGGQDVRSKASLKVRYR